MLYLAQSNSYSSGVDVDIEACEVKINGNDLVISFEEDGEFTLYRGYAENDKPDFFRIKCKDSEVEGNLIRWGNNLYGSYRDEGFDGAWIIKLLKEKMPQKNSRQK